MSVMPVKSVFTVEHANRWHWCSRVENPPREFGLKDPRDESYADLIERVSETNRRLLAAVALESP